MQLPEHQKARLRNANKQIYQTQALCQLYDVDSALSDYKPMMSAWKRLQMGLPPGEHERVSNWLRSQHHAHMRKHRYEFQRQMRIWEQGESALTVEHMRKVLQARTAQGANRVLQSGLSSLKQDDKPRFPLFLPLLLIKRQAEAGTFELVDTSKHGIAKREQRIREETSVQPSPKTKHRRRSRLRQAWG